MSAMRTCKCGCGRQFELPKGPGQKKRMYLNAKHEAMARAQRRREEEGNHEPLSEKVRNEADMAPIREQAEVLEALCSEAAERTDMGRGASLLLQCLGVAT